MLGGISWRWHNSFRGNGFVSGLCGWGSSLGRLTPPRMGCHRFRARCPAFWAGCRLPLAGCRAVRGQTLDKPLAKEKLIFLWNKYTFDRQAACMRKRHGQARWPAQECRQLAQIIGQATVELCNLAQTTQIFLSPMSVASKGCSSNCDSFLVVIPCDPHPRQ